MRKYDVCILKYTNTKYILGNDLVSSTFKQLDLETCNAPWPCE